MRIRLSGKFLTLAAGFGFAVFCIVPPAMAASAEPVKIAIIIDDLGYKLAEGKRAIRLAGQVTLSIIPFSPHAKKLAHMAKDHHKEVLLHAPMTPMAQRPWEVGLTSEMSEQELSARVDAMLTEVPYAKGLNNHGGSRFTQDRERMDWLMTALKERGLFFIDSRTTAETTGTEAALAANIPYNARDIFLDNQLEEEAIIRQLDRLVSIAVKSGEAIAIGHPHRQTLNVLEVYLPQLREQGIEVVNASVLLKNLPPTELNIPPPVALKTANSKK